MGAVLGSLGGFSAMSMCGEAACCFGSAAISACCCKSCACKHSTVTRIAYAILLFVITIAAWLMLNPGIDDKLEEMSKYTGLIEGCGTDSTGGTTDTPVDCDKRWGQLGVYRVMFASTVFFSLLSAIMIGVKSSTDGRAGIQNGWWGLKLFFLLGLSVGAFFIPNSFFHQGFSYVAMIGGFLFLIIQLILLVDFAHAWADSWIGKMEEGSNLHKWLIILASVGMYLFSFVATVLLFVYYTSPYNDNGDKCSLNKFAISFNMIVCIVITCVAVNGRVQEVLPGSGLLQAGVIVSYITYLTWSAISETEGYCQPGSMDANDTTTTVVGAMFTFIAVCYASLRTSSASQLGSLGMTADHDAEAGAALLDDNDDDDDNLESGEGDATKSSGKGKGSRGDDERNSVLYNWTFFHLTFAFASMYLMMVLTDWGMIRDGHQADFHVGRGQASTWVKIISAWLSAALYIWSLVAPLCLPNREFD